MISYEKGDTAAARFLQKERKDANCRPKKTEEQPDFPIAFKEQRPLLAKERSMLKGKGENRLIEARRGGAKRRTHLKEPRKRNDVFKAA